MSRLHEIDPKIKAEIRSWIERLLNNVSGEDKKNAAAELGRLGVQTRGSIRTRGTFKRPAVNRLPDPEKIQDVARCLREKDTALRRQVALALGEWGGEEAAAALTHLLQWDTDEMVLLHAITALRNIGGDTAVEALRRVAEIGTEVLRDASLSAIEDLVTGGRIECTENHSVSSLLGTPSGSGTVKRRLRGTMRTRGDAKQTQLGGIVSTLSHIRDDEMASKYLRQRAEQMLMYFQK